MKQTINNNLKTEIMKNLTIEYGKTVQNEHLFVVICEKGRTWFMNNSHRKCQNFIKKYNK